MAKNSFGAAAKLRVGDAQYEYFRLAVLEEKGVGPVSHLPFSIKILLENLLRFEDGRRVSAADVDYVAHGGSSSASKEISFMPARVLLQDPAILILDEATASVDPLTEAQIQEGLNIVLQNRTAIVIAHRLSTIKSADRIIVLRNGQIIEEGDHATLTARGGHYAELYDTYFRHQSLAYIESWRKDSLDIPAD